MIEDGFNEIYSIQFCINFRNILKKIIGGAYISQRVRGISWYILFYLWISWFQAFYFELFRLIVILIY